MGNTVTIVANRATQLLSATAAATGNTHRMPSLNTTYQASSDASHANSTTIKIEVSNDGVLWIWKGDIVVTGASDTSGFALQEAWAFVRARCSTHGDSTNTVTVTMGS